MAYPVSTTFKNLLPYSHQVACKILITDPISGATLATLSSITDGSMTEDRAQTSRRKASFSAVDDTGLLTPVTASDLLMPFGNEFRPYVGIVNPVTQVAEYVPLGVFGITDTMIDDSGDAFLISCQGEDRSDVVSRAGFPDTYTVTSGTTVGAAANAILSFIGLSYLQTIFTDQMPMAQKVYNIGDDPWSALLEIFTSAGANIYFNELGVLVSANLVTYTNATPDWQVAEGTAGNLLALQRHPQRDDTIANWIVVTGESPDNLTAIPAGTAYDSDPNSPTYAFGKYGIVRQHVQDSTITTNADAAIMAQHILEESLGLSEEVTMTILANPAMQVDDLVNVNRVKSKLVNINVVIDQVTIPFTAQRAGEAISRRRAIAS